ncbi:ABC transporter permease [Kovacikia minuta CCNUW1]|uniref:ABC transporter permease n=1 Tax=Kovacikia minuta TaxID=2931930 RepID=UPI001CD0338E|nr:ABC transporter permease [Kovacikia minuta]UBF24246.1 ABC transporter permease [Kovacikia minuta CCNUW1]
MALSRSNWRSTAEVIVIPIAALFVALVLFGIFCAFLGKNPFAIYGAIYKTAFGNWRSFQGTLLRAAPLMLTSLCTALPARLGLMIIGNEGALVMGGIGATIAGLLLSYGSLLPSPDQVQNLLGLPPLSVQLGMALGGIVFGGIWIAIVGALRHYRAVNETISSLLMNYIAIAFLNHLVEGPMKDPASLNKPSSFPIPEAYRLGNIDSTRIHYGLIYGIIACLIAYFLIQHTTFGFAARTAGGNVKAARIAGLPVGKLTVIICFLAGSCAGLAGMVEVAAVQGQANASLVAGYGYAGILVAFVARYNPLAAIVVATLLGGIINSGGALQRSFNMPDATVLVFQGLVFLVVLYSESLYGRLKIFKEPEVKATPPAASTAVPV